MTDIKVIVDTNVIIAASINYYIDEIQRHIRHPLNKHAQKLFDLFSNSKNKIGILVPKVESESYGVLAKAVKTEITKQIDAEQDGREYLYENTEKITERIDEIMKNLWSYLNKMSLRKKDVDENMKKVIKMSKCLKLFHANTRHTQDDLTQLCEFVKNDNSGDQQILAEAITTKQNLSNIKTPPILLLASMDMRFFVPYNYGIINSDIVTQKIYECFEIQCMYPHQIIVRVQVEQS